MGLRRVTSNSLTQVNLHKTNKQVGQHKVAAPLVLERTTSNLRLTRLTTARTRGKPPPSPIQYSMCLSAAPTPEWLFVPGLPRRSPKLPRFGVLELCETITICSNLGWGGGLKQSCSSRRELSNGVSHFTCTHQGRVDS